MPRTPRQDLPNTVHHLISRFVNRSFRMTTELQRQEYRRRVGAVVARTDWRPLGYALMSNHVHWVARSGCEPARRFIQPLHVGFAQWLNLTSKTLGPVFANRFTAIACAEEGAALVLAYIHNNPVRAGVVTDPAESTWTSHRAYLGQEPAPPWLDVEQGLSLCGYNASPSGRWGFHDFVISLSGEGRSLLVGGGNLAAQRLLARQRLGGPAELDDGVLEAGGRTHHIVSPEAAVMRPRWRGSPMFVLRCIAEQTGVPVQAIQGRERQRQMVSARRVALLVWRRHLGRAQGEMGDALGLCSAAASQLLTRGLREDEETQADRIARRCWNEEGRM